MSSQDADVGMKCIKYMLFTTNFMFAMIGFLLISVGTTITTIYTDFEVFMENHFFSPASLLVAVGVIIFFVSLFGCFGAYRRSTVLVNIYALLLLLILILEISAAIAAYSMRANIKSSVEKNMNTTMAEYKTDDYSKGSWDFMQERLECCGIYGPTDWKEEMPKSCNPQNPEIVPGNTTGCLNKLSYIVTECATLVGTGGICVAIVQLLGVIFAGMLAKSIRRLKTEAELQRQENQRFYAQLANGSNQKPTPVLFESSDVSA